MTSSAGFPDAPSLLDATGLPIVVVDGAGAVVQYTEPARQIYAFGPGSRGQALAEIAHLATAMPPLPRPSTLTAAGEGNDEELTTHDGRTFVRRARPYLLPGQTDPGMVLTFAEVTRFKLAQETAQRRAAELRALTDSLPVLISLIDRDHRYQFHNQSYLRWFGEEARDMRGQPLSEVMGEAAYRAIAPHLAEAFAGKAVHFEAELDYRTGGPRWVEARFIPYLSESGEVTGVFALVLDIGDRQRLAVELAEAKHAAEQANRAKSLFLANMSHEIRTPLAAMIGYLDLLSSHLQDGDDRACADLIRRNGQHLQRIIHDLLDLAKVEAGSLTLRAVPFVWRELVEDVLALVRPRAAEKGLTLSVRVPGPLPSRVTSDPTRLRQILINLLGNAVKFSHKGQIQLEVDWDAERQHLRFRVIDQGVGMTSDQIARAVRPFMALEPDALRATGPGLGLAISNHLASLLGGGLVLESAPDQGTTATFTVDPGRFDQVVWSEDEPRAIGANEHPLPRLDGLRVLLADDRREIRYLIQTFLEEAGAEVESVADGTQAVQKVTESLTQGRTFDGVVIDIQMPRLDGREATRLLRRLDYQGPVLALTASAMKGEAARCLEAGCDAYLSKPVERTQLIETLAQLVKDKPAHLPLADRETPAAPVPAVTVAFPNPAPSAPAILIVDDDPDAAESFAALLEMEGYGVRTARDGESARREAESQAFDLVFLDLTFPRETGYDILSSLREKLSASATPVVALSGHDSQEERQRAQRAGFRDYLTKPVSAERLLTVVRRLVSDRLGRLAG